jgi:rare lipoprotein A
MRAPATLLGAALLLTGCAAGGGAPVAHLQPDGGGGEVGVASYYASRFEGRRTASGERYDPDELTAAHRTLAFGTRVRVTRLDDGRDVVVRINDRGPFVEGRVIDLSYAAAKQIDLLQAGVAEVQLDVLP